LNQRVSHIALIVKDYEEAIRFYTEKLGFEIRADVTNGDFRWISVGLKSQPDLEFGLLALKPGGLLTEDDVQMLTKLVESGKLVVLVVGLAGRADIIAIQQPLGVACILGGDQAGRAQHPQCPQRQIFRVADRRADEIKRSHH
jgi:catechol 2,3-dioxygenase-like lactoylglutathione lyase family enzyme